MAKLFNVVVGKISDKMHFGHAFFSEDKKRLNSLIIGS